MDDHALSVIMNYFRSSPIDLTISISLFLKENKLNPLLLSNVVSSPLSNKISVYNFLDGIRTIPVEDIKSISFPKGAVYVWC